ncbi:LOW QUALITY PROTEIN: hypothetical protein BC938DRAFT_475857, partial [Jimgerdemannia flammicorona]
MCPNSNLLEWYAFDQARLAIETAHENLKTAVAENARKSAQGNTDRDGGIEERPSNKGALDENADRDQTTNNGQISIEVPQANKGNATLEQDDEKDVGALWEPEASYLRNILATAKKSKNTFDSQLAEHGIIRLSSRKEDETSGMGLMVRKQLTSDELTSLKNLLSLPQISQLDGYSELVAKTLPEMRNKIDNRGVPKSIQDRTVRRVQDLLLVRIFSCNSQLHREHVWHCRRTECYDCSVSGLEGKADLRNLWERERGLSSVPQALIYTSIISMGIYLNFLCAHIDVVKSREKEHHLWDGAFLDVEEFQKPHMVLIEVSGGTEGTSKIKADDDLLKLAK